MSLFGRRKKSAERPGPSRDEALAAAPVRSLSITETATDEGIVLGYPATVTPWFGALAMRLGLWDGRPMMRRLRLDDMGCTVWSWIDGRRDVRTLAAMLAERYTLHPREAEASMTVFLRELGRRGIIALRPLPVSRETA